MKYAFECGRITTQVSSFELYAYFVMKFAIAQIRLHLNEPNAHCSLYTHKHATNVAF